MEVWWVWAAVVAVGFSAVDRGFAGLWEDREALVDFIANVPHRTGDLNWYPFASICESWIGVTCDADRSRIVGVSLPNMGLNGSVPAGTLARLSALRTLDLHSNSLSGSFPPDIKNLPSLTSLQLQLNHFSGPLPSDDLSVCSNLTYLDLSSNSFNGSIPSSISDLDHLSTLNLSNNLMYGNIPDIDMPTLASLDLSNNHLEGLVPKSLLRFPSSSFSGNSLYATAPSPHLSTLAPPNPTNPRRKLKQSLVLGIIAGGCALVLLAILLLLALCFFKRKHKDVVSEKLAKGDLRSIEKSVTITQKEENKLIFFEGCTLTFDLEDLLRASAEVLGKGTYGMAYKAVLEDSSVVVVKRVKDVSVGKKEFEQQMGLVGKLKHENLVELRAYYYSKDEKLMVYDYHSLGSVHFLIHGKSGESRSPLNWETRLQIALGAARGIAHIHSECGGKLVHGNIKSSNIFLNADLFGCVSDLGIASLVNHAAAGASRTMGYRAPEVIGTRKVTQMSDVYSFGVVLLELLTGKSPIEVRGGGEDVFHLVRWVQSVLREEWTAEVFDEELLRTPNIEEEMVELLRIAMTCVVRMPDQRPKIAEVVNMIEDVKRLDGEDCPSPEARSEESSVQMLPMEEAPPLTQLSPL